FRSGILAAQISDTAVLEYGPTEILLGFGAISKYLRVSADLVVQPAAPARRGKPGSRPSKKTAGERQTVCWKGMDSNFRYRGRRPASGRSLRAQRVEDRCRKKGVRIRQLLVFVALGREWWARRRSVLSVSDPRERC